jgi:hypothetical protein
VSSEAAKPKKASKKKKAEEAAGAPHMKLDSTFCSLNETFEVPNIRNLKYTFSYPIPG